MALNKGINSYVTVTEADEYFANRLDADAWTSSDETTKEKALITATAVLNDLSWIGVAVSSSQTLAFPRSGSYFDPRLGISVSMDTTVPDRIVRANSELALHLLNNEGLLDDTGRVDSISVSAINLSRVINPNVVNSVTKNIIKPLLANNGSRSWWRAA